ncbi:hypothetical protein C0R05_32280 [Streptomyces albidoflavus]|nr:hypothetical protein C0R05_32280 [Streptomyces albidoflavus]
MKPSSSSSAPGEGSEMRAARPVVADIPVHVITGAACFNCRLPFRPPERVLPVPYDLSGLRAALRHDTCPQAASKG